MQPILAKWAAGEGVSERVFLFREERVKSARPGKPQARRLRQAQRRALLRRLEHVTSQLERTPEYRQSLQSVLELGSQLQSVLDAAQREHWLALEEALFDHSARLHRAYFCAGVEYGQSRVLGAAVSAPAVSAPAVSAPAVSAPAVSAPAVSAPAVSPAGAANAAGVRTLAASSSAAASGARQAAALELEILGALARWRSKLMRE
jgi:hypothetical protein